MSGAGPRVAGRRRAASPDRRGPGPAGAGLGPVRRAASGCARLERVRGRLVALGVVLVAAGLAWVVLVSLAARGPPVTVGGTARVAPSRCAQAAAALARRASRWPGSTATRSARRVLAALPPVQTVLVQRRWPGTVHLTVVERTAVAVTAAPGGVGLLDADGVLFAVEKKAPAGLPRRPRLAAGLTGRAGRPRHVGRADGAARAAGLGGPGRGGPGRHRRRGGHPHAHRRAERALGGRLAQPRARLRCCVPLLRTKATVYDVSAPDLVTTR